jgi:protein ImuB
LIGEPAAIAKELARALDEAAIEARVAIAPTQTMARLLAAANSEISTFSNFQISDLPVSLLQPLETLPPAMNHRDRRRPYETFERWGIATLGDLAALPVAALSSRLGRRGVALHRLARGLDPQPFVPDADTPRFIGRLELEWPIEALEPLSFVFARLLEPLSVSLERADRGAAAIRLELRLTDRSTHARVLQLPAPIRDARVLRTLLLLDLESHPPPAAVDIVTIELDPAPARITQFSLLQRALPSPETLSTLTARLAALVGESRIGSPVLIDTHQPGAFEMVRFAPETRAISSRRSDEVAKADAMTRFAPEGAKSAAGANGAEGAGANGANGAVLRRRRVPPAIRVSVEHGRPVYLAASRRGMPQGAVVQAAGPWRTSGGWWAAPVAPPVPPTPAFAGEGGWNRDEWDVALSSGAVCRIFQDRTSARWFLEGTYD